MGKHPIDVSEDALGIRSTPSATGVELGGGDAAGKGSGDRARLYRAPDCEARDCAEVWGPDLRSAHVGELNRGHDRTGGIEAVEVSAWRLYT